MQRLVFLVSFLMGSIRRRLAVLTLFFLVVLTADPLMDHNLVYGAEFFCSSGDVDCLIAAINQSNQNGEPNTINLELGTYTLTAADNDTDGANGLPSITGTITIQGPKGSGSTIDRDPGARAFRLFQVAGSGVLNLKWLGLSGGNAGGGTCNPRGYLWQRGRYPQSRNSQYFSQRHLQQQGRGNRQWRRYL